MIGFFPVSSHTLAMILKFWTAKVRIYNLNEEDILNYFTQISKKEAFAPIFRTLPQIYSMDKHFVSTSYGTGMASSAAIGNHTITMDTTAEHGGTDSGPGPKRLMLASLAGCTGIDIVGILLKMKVAYSDLSIDTEGTLSETSPKTYTHVKVTYKIKLEKDTDRPKMEKAVALSEDKYCGVMAMFRSFAKLEREIIYL